MSYVYLLAGDNIDLAEAELTGFLRSQEFLEDPYVDKRIAITSSEPDRLRRLALTHEVGKLIFRGKIEDFEKKLPEGSFKVRAEIVGETEMDKKTIEEKMGGMIQSGSREVDLENPQNTFKVYIMSNEIILSKRILDIDRSLFDERSNEKRDYSSPVSLDPVLARVMVNLSEVSAGDRILDPFCGTGGILIEAGLCGIGVLGSDVSGEMVEGTEGNLEKYGIINNDIRKERARKAVESFDSFRAIVTDLPYGKASEKSGNIEENFLEILDSFEGKTVFCYNKPEIGSYRSDYQIYIHKNLTRHIFVT